MASNNLRLHWLLRSLTRNRLSLNERSAVYVAACQSASLGWLASFADSAWGDYHPREGSAPEPEEKCLTTAADAEALRKLLGDRIAGAAKNGALFGNQDLAYLLYRWCDLSNDDGAAVKEWMASQLASDEGLKKFAAAFTSHGWSQGLGGLGDLVARRTTRAQVKGLERLITWLSSGGAWKRSPSLGTRLRYLRSWMRGGVRNEERMNDEWRVLALSMEAAGLV